MTTTRPNVEAVRIGAGRTTLSVLDGVCVVYAHDVLDLTLYLETVYRLAGMVRDHDCTAFVFDCAKACVAMGEGDFQDARDMVGPQANSRLRIPGAFVAPVPLIKIVKKHLWSLVQGGLERVAFTDSLAALAWAQRRAREVRLLRLDAQGRTGFDQSVPSAL